MTEARHLRPVPSYTPVQGTWPPAIDVDRLRRHMRYCQAISAVLAGVVLFLEARDQ